MEKEISWLSRWLLPGFLLLAPILILAIMVSIGVPIESDAILSAALWYFALVELESILYTQFERQIESLPKIELAMRETRPDRVQLSAQNISGIAKDVDVDITGLDDENFVVRVRENIESVAFSGSSSTSTISIDAELVKNTLITIKIEFVDKYGKKRNYIFQKPQGSFEIQLIKRSPSYHGILLPILKKYFIRD